MRTIIFNFAGQRYPQHGTAPLELQQGKTHSTRHHRSYKYTRSTLSLSLSHLISPGIFTGLSFCYISLNLSIDIYLFFEKKYSIMAQNIGSVQAGAPDYQDRSHTQAAHTNPNQKPGLMDKIKHMIPGGQTQTQTQTGHPSSTQTGHPSSTQKPGLVDKFKDMLPGSQTQTGNSNPNQKPGLMDKIKAKIPGGQNK